MLFRNFVAPPIWAGARRAQLRRSAIAFNGTLGLSSAAQLALASRGAIRLARIVCSLTTPLLLTQKSGARSDLLVYLEVTACGRARVPRALQRPIRATQSVLPRSREQFKNQETEKC